MKVFIALGFVALVAVGITVAGSFGGQRYAEVPVFALCAIIAFAVQWLIFIPSYLHQTERFFDLTGSATYITVVGLALALAPAPDGRRLLLGLCIVLWALRLGTFLFLRILRDGRDPRFDRIKSNPLRLFLTWSLQGLWIVVTSACALAAITSGVSGTGVDWTLPAGMALWLTGFVTEAIADWQKRRFRRRAGSDAFIATGLWRFSRHPNYAGEILLWCGIAVMAVPALQGWQYVTLISPLFVYLLLTRVSGIPLLEAKAQKQWGDDPAYQRYRESTPALFPWPR